MRCWVFDWPGKEFPKVNLFVAGFQWPGPELLSPGRRWVFDNPSDGSVWVRHSSFSILDDTPLIPAGGTPEESAVLAAIEQRWAGAKVVRSVRAPGERYARIWRGKHSEPPVEESHSFFGAVASAELLFERFRRVLMTVEPEPRNRHAFGHELRQLLILGSTEVESAWRSILVANHYPPPPKDRFTTNDYCKLLKPLRLDAWKVELAMSPGYGAIEPFGGWDAQSPTTSLSWYADQHLAKHDRETNLDRATLENVVSAMAAVFVMLAAQVGPSQLSGTLVRSDFLVTGEPQWPLEEEDVPPIGRRTETTLVFYPFPP